MNTTKNILIVASGSIGIINLPQYIMELKSQNYNVKCILTEDAASFLPAKTLSAYVDVFTDKESFGGTIARVPHIVLGQWASLVLVLPASANIIAKITHGIADNLATTTILSTNAKMIIFPNMGAIMSEQFIVKENIQKLKNRNYEVYEEYKESYSVSKGIEENSFSLPSIEKFNELINFNVSSIERR